jgi:hypothetical protein
MDDPIDGHTFQTLVPSDPVVLVDYIIPFLKDPKGLQRPLGITGQIGRAHV